MSRFVQIKNEDGTYSYVERRPERHSTGLDIHVQGDIDPFRSPVDGSVITSRRDLAAHNERNGVVNQFEFGTEKEQKSFFERKAKEREDFYNSTERTAYGKRLARERREQILDAIKRNGG